jgi:fibronectin type 3 domain-containing protein
MDAGSGTVLTDLSGTGNHGTISSGTWSTSGKYGGALSFNGTSSLVTVPDSASLDLTTGMTEEAWVRPAALGGTWRTVLMKERPGGMAYDLYAHGTEQTNVPTAEINLGGADQTANGTAALTLNVWTHLAATYDGTTLRLYVNGAQVSQRVVSGAIVTSTSPLRIGGNTIYGERFSGLIDEVRIYNRALSATEVQDDMNRAIGPADTQAPSAPANLTATGSLANAQLSWSAASDNVAVVRYNVHRSTTSGFTPSAANRVAQPTATTYTDTPPAGTYYYKVTAEDGAGNVSAASNESAATQVGDTIAPSAPGALTAIGAIGKATLTWGAATDNLAVVRYNVHRSTSSGFTPSAANRIAQPTSTSYTDTSPPGTYYYKVTAEDAAGNVGPASNQASADITTDAQAPSAPTGLTATQAGNGVTLAWTASTDNVGVSRYNVHRSDTAGFTPSAANRIAQPAGAGYSDGGLSSGTYHYKVTAEDAAGNVSGASNQASVTVTIVAPTGLVAAYGFDEGSGTTTADQSGNGNTGTLSNTAWIPGGRYGGALSFDGSARVNVADSASLHLTTGMTLEAWVKPIALGGYNTVILKERTGFYAEALYANTDGNRPSANVYTSGDHEQRGPAAVPVGAWTHLAATYNGATLALFVNGVSVATQAATGSIASNVGPLRIGGNAIWGEYFNGLIDEVRVYNRALSASEIQGDMDRSVTPDTTAPTITGRTPANGAGGINVGTAATATFSEPVRASTVSASTFTLAEQGGPSVAVTVSYDAPTSTASLRPQSALRYGVTYQLTVKGGTGGVTDLAGNPLAADSTWTFTTEATPPQILILTAASNPFGAYAAEILRNEGLNAFTTIDASLISPTFLTGFDVVLLGDTPLSGAQVATLSGWVNAGGNLIALRPDKQLAGLLGLTDAGTTLANAYLKIDTTGSSPGAGIVGSTIQYHGTADRYTLNGAQAIATLYSNATTATANPAVTLRSVGSNGGEAAAFTFDLARSVVYTRQGNPGWAGQERDGVAAVRPDDMFFGAKPGDIQPDWLDTSRIAIPQADEQQRLLMNLITRMERDKLPLPHFWYLPRGKKAVVVLSGDDHSPAQAPGGTASHFDRYKTLSPAGCVVAEWTCVRSTSYVYPSATVTNAQAASYVS